MIWERLFGKRRQRVKLLDVEAKLAQAEQDRDEAKDAGVEARELADWAERQNRANRFDLRLAAAYRLQAGHHD